MQTACAKEHAYQQMLCSVAPLEGSGAQPLSVADVPLSVCDQLTHKLLPVRLRLSSCFQATHCLATLALSRDVPEQMKGPCRPDPYLPTSNVSLRQSWVPKQGQINRSWRSVLGTLETTELAA